MRFSKFAAAAFVTAMLSIGCETDVGGRASDWPDTLPDEIIGMFSTEETDSGKVKWKLTAPLGRRFIKEQAFYMDSPVIEFYDDFGALQSTLVSKKGKYSQLTGDMLAYGDVVVTTVDGDRLETDSLRYFNELDKIVSDCFVRLKRGNDLITGVGLECDHNLSSVDIKKDFEATIIGDDKDPGE